MKTEYELKWSEYRRIRRHGLFALIALFTIPFATVEIFAVLLKFGAFQFLNNLTMLPFLLGAIFLVVAAYFQWRQYTWECPRCGEPFGRLHEECRNCGLPRWACSAPEEQEGKDTPTMQNPRI